jgi:hypothetical protein
MKKLICYSLWGTDPKYTIGAIKNAQSVKTIYGDDWTARFYCGTSVPNDIIECLKKESAEVVIMKEAGNWSGMFWRFTAITEPDVEVMLSRDTDSRLTLREKAAVDDWLASEKLFHVMRDHPEHNTTILGGMWGARKPILQDMKHILEWYHDTNGNYWQVDQKFLHNQIWPRIAYSVKIHDEFFEKKPFPTKRNGYEFVGQVWDENEVTVQEHVDLLARALK